MPNEPYADPEDLQFGSAAAKKEEELDQAVREGRSPDELDDASVEDDLRPGGKAEPAGEGRTS